jgi:hypothetical protein
MAGPTTQDLFRQWLQTEIAPTFRAEGWAKSGNNFRLRRSGTIGVIQLAKSPWSRADHLWFWLKAGVWSERLAKVDAQLDQGSPSRPTPDECHWALWYDQIMRPGEDWELRRGASEAELTALGRDVRDRAFALVAPKVMAHMSDEAIREELIAGYIPPSGSRLTYLYALVAAIGPIDRLEGIISELRREAPRVAERLGLT